MMWNRLQQVAHCAVAVSTLWIAGVATTCGAAAASADTPTLGALSWRFAGPMIGGRVNAVVGYPELSFTEKIIHPIVHRYEKQLRNV